jgi:hypothetical protein
MAGEIIDAAQTLDVDFVVAGGTCILFVSDAQSTCAAFF